MPIVTSRLLLRPPQAGDGARLTAAKRESWAALSRWLAFADKPIESINDTEDEIYVRQKHSQFILRTDLTLLVFDRQGTELIGSSGLHDLDWEARVMSLGYWMRTSKTGNGYAAEVALALTKYAFEHLGANRLTISHADGNVRSQRIIEKLGFEKEGVSRKSYLLQGQLVDAHHYARLNTHGLP